MTDCENCGTPSVELVRVRRVYLTPESWDTPASRRVLEEPESDRKSTRLNSSHT